MGSRILGLVRELVFAAFFGAGVANDAFNIAFRIPNLLRDLFAEGALSAAFVATFSQTLSKHGERESWRLANLINNALIVVLSLIVIAGIIFAPYIVDILMGSTGDFADPVKAKQTYDLAVRMTRILFPFLLMVSLAAVAMGVLNTKDRFGVPASASTMFNVGSIFGGLFFAYLLAPVYVSKIISALINRREVPLDEHGASDAIIGMAIGTLIGGMLQWLIQVPSMRAVGYRWRPMISFSDPGVRQIMRLMAPAIIGSAALQINLVVNTNFATSLGSGRVSWLAYAFRMILLPLGIFGVAISTATLPVASRAATLENLDEFRRTVSSSMRLTLLLTIPSAIGLMVLSRPIIALIYQRASFTAYDTNQTALALRYFAIGLVAYSLVRLLYPTFFALGDARVPMIASLISILTNFVVATLSVDYLRMGHSGLALSISIVAIINFLVLFFFMRRKLGHLDEGEFSATFGKVLIASLIMGVLSWLTSHVIENRFGTERFSLLLIEVGASIAVGLIVYYLLVRLLRVSELDQITGALRRKLDRRKK